MTNAVSKAELNPDDRSGTFFPNVCTNLLYTTDYVNTTDLPTRNLLSQKQCHTYPYFLFKCKTKCLPSYNTQYLIKYILRAFRNNPSLRTNTECVTSTTACHTRQIAKSELMQFSPTTVYLVCCEYTR